MPIYTFIYVSIYLHVHISMFLFMDIPMYPFTNIHIRSAAGAQDIFGNYLNNCESSDVYISISQYSNDVDNWDL